MKDPASLKNFVCIEPATFHEHLQRLGPMFAKRDTWYHKSLHPGFRLATTLHFLATSDSFYSLMYGFRVTHNMINLIARDMCKAVIAIYEDEVVSCHNIDSYWHRIANRFSERWQFHHALWPLDGKHIAIKCPKKARSLYYNYKGFHSIILLVLVDGSSSSTLFILGLHILANG